MLFNIRKKTSHISLLLAVFLTIGAFNLHAYSQQNHILTNTKLELSYGHYQVSDSRYQDVYSEGGGILSLEILRFVRNHHPHYIGVAGGIRRFSNTGYSTLTQEETRLKLFPLALGVRYFLKAKYLTPWVEIGMDYFMYDEKSDIHDTNGSTWGYHIQGGIYVPFPGVPSLMLKFHARHTKATANENGLNINLGGPEFSLGLAFGFNFI